MLTPLVDRLWQFADRRVIVGGAASPDQANPAALGLQRAVNVRAYLVGQVARPR